MSNNRLDFIENNYYHIYNRGFEKQIIFKNDDDFSRFYAYVIRYQKQYNDSIRIVSYCFLPNHFHFIFRVKQTGLDLSDFMRKLQGAYAMYCKRKYLETGLKKGPLFEGRFKSKHIDTEEYLHQCMAYVSYNPLKHKIVNTIEEYKWTSYHQITGNKKVTQYRDFELGELEW